MLSPSVGYVNYLSWAAILRCALHDLSAWNELPPHINRHLGALLELPLINRHLGVFSPPPVAALRCRRPAHPLVPVSMGCWVASCWREKAFAIHIQEGMHSATCTYAVRSTDGGCVARQHQSAATGGERRAHQRGGLSTNSAGSPAHCLWRAPISFAAPMAGASPRQHRSAATGGGRRSHQRGGFSNSQMSRRDKIKIAAKELESDPS